MMRAFRIASLFVPPIAAGMIAFHGTADPFVPYNGLPCRTSHETGKPVCLPSQPDLMRFWADAET